MSRILVVGLGNPGPKYESTRHNIGFMALDRLAARSLLRVETAKFKGAFATGTLSGQDVAYLKPQTFMNLSGDSVQRAASFFDVAAESIIVVHDELDLPCGTVRLKQGGGHGGHNGLRDLIQKLGSREFVRVRMGIDRPPGRGDVTGWVLGPFAKREEPLRDEMIEVACDAVEAIVSEGITLAQNRFNAS